MTATALIIDDEPDIRELIAMTLSRMGLDHHSAANLEEARTLLSAYEFDVCLTDMRLPDGNGVEFVRFIQSTHPTLPVAVITAHGNMDAAVDAMKNGAFDFVSKPVDIQQLRQLVVQAIALGANGSDNAASNDARIDATDDIADTDSITESIDAAPQPLREKNESKNLQDLSGRNVTGSGETSTNGEQNANRLSVNGHLLVGDSEPMQDLRKMIAKVARSNAPVWITGESGTGKELIARLIHDNSPRNDKPFVAINCGAIPNELMESEFFGHTKGSFTGATTDKQGLFQLADGGTLFLDEVAELPLHMQVKLLRAIQERSIRAVGANQEIPVDARILSASHKDLASEVEQARFRHDLYYRLNVISLHSPSLRERREDIPLLCKSIMVKLASASGFSRSDNISLAEDALLALSEYTFPGNVRELENLLERALALVDSNTITATDLQISTAKRKLSSFKAEPGSSEAKGPSKGDEASRIIDALNSTRWNRKEAAKLLGLTYRQLRYRITQLGIDSNKS